MNTMEHSRREFFQRAIALTLLNKSQFINAGETPENSISKIRSRLRTIQLQENKNHKVERWISSISENSTWSDINYADRSIGNWLPIEHLIRIKRISASIFTLQNQKTQQEALRIIDSGLQKWIEINPSSDNWWHNTIGQQLQICAILIMTQGNISEKTLNSSLAKLTVPNQIPEDRKTAQNLIWYVTQQLYRGVLTNSAEDIKTASKIIQKTLIKTNLEGLQDDFSFHQHGSQLYTGGYGLEFLKNHATFAAILHDTEWAYDKRSMENLLDYCFEGIAPIMRMDWIDYGARGREITRKKTNHIYPSIETSFNSLASICPERKEKLASRLGDIKKPGLGGFLPYTKAFPRSDFICHQTKDGYFSVKSMSSRTVGTESGNGENLRGYWLPFGSTFIVKDGTEYEKILSNWRWSKVPGVTAPDIVPSFKGYLKGTDKNVGVVSAGLYGISVMPLNTQETECVRAWFIAENQMIALGCNLTSTHAKAIFTTLDQTLYRGNFLIDDEETAPTSNKVLFGKKVTHNEITYESIVGSNLEVVLSRDPQEPEVAATTLQRESSKETTLTICINHGIQPKEKFYAYKISLSDNIEKTQVVSNERYIQAIEFENSGTTLAALHKSVVLHLDHSTSIKSKMACLVIAERQDQSWRLTVHPTENKNSSDVIDVISGRVESVTYL